MARNIIYRWHRNGLQGIVSDIGDTPPHEIIEKMQRDAKNHTAHTGITWTVSDGDMVQALIDSAKL